MTARLIIADDHDVVRRGLRSVLEAAPGFSVVGEAADGAEAERLARAVPADLLILDIAMPAKRGMQVLESLRAGGSELAVLFFSIHPASQYADYARRKGAQGFVGKDEPSDELLRAVRRICAGGTRFPRRRQVPAAAGSPLLVLSLRETEVMHGLLRGEPLREIADRLGVDARSVSTYRRRLLDKLGLLSNAELIAFMARPGSR